QAGLHVMVAGDRGHAAEPDARSGGPPRPAEQPAAGQPDDTRQQNDFDRQRESGSHGWCPLGGFTVVRGTRRRPVRMPLLSPRLSKKYHIHNETLMSVT